MMIPLILFLNKPMIILNKHSTSPHDFIQANHRHLLFLLYPYILHKLILTSLMFLYMLFIIDM